MGGTVSPRLPLLSVLLHACLSFCALSGLPLLAGQESLERECLIAYDESIRALQATAFDATIDWSSTALAIRTTQTVRVDRSEAAAAITFEHYQQQADGDMRLSWAGQATSDGRTSLLYTSFGEHAPEVTVYPADQLTRERLLRDHLGGAELLFGIADQHVARFGNTISEIMARATVEPPRRTSLDGRPVWLVVAALDGGSILLWLDPALHYYPARIELDFATNEWRHEQVVEVSRTIPLDAACFPVEATVTTTHTKAGSEPTTFRTTYTASGVQRNEPGKSIALDAPNGTRVKDATRRQVLLEWFDGAIRTTWSRDVVRHIDNIVARVLDGTPRTRLRDLAPTGSVEPWDQDPFVAGEKTIYEGGLYVPPRTEPYCGINALYAACRLVGCDVDFADLVNTDVISSRGGSTVADLVRAATRTGARAVPFENLTVTMLLEAREPFILHVANSAGEYSHFVLFLGLDEAGERAFVYDPPGPVQHVTLRELRRRWAGDAVGVASASAEEFGLQQARRATVRRGAILVVVAFGLLLVVHLGSRLRREGEHSIGSIATAVAREAVLLVILSGGLAFAWNPGSRSAHATFASNRAALEEPDESRFETVDAARVRQMASAGAVIVDARNPLAFQQGSLPDAINIPTYLNRLERLERMRGVAKDRQIVVFCQSRQCTFSEAVAQNLGYDGFVNIAIFSGGWVDWSGSGGD